MHFICVVLQDKSPILLVTYFRDHLRKTGNGRWMSLRVTRSLPYPVLEFSNFCYKLSIIHGTLWAKDNSKKAGHGVLICASASIAPQSYSL